MPFVNKFKILVCTACLMLVGQGFAMDAWIDHRSADADAPKKVNECYQITSPAELAWFAKKVNDNQTPYCAKVMADLDMAGYHWIPISAKGTQRAVDFDGNNKIISNLYISAEEILKKYPNDRQYAQNLGLIGAFTGHVQNVILENVEVYAYGNGYVSGNKDNEKSPLSIGTVVGWQANPNSIVENCYVTGKMVTSGDGQAVGGIVGNNGGGTIRNCYSEVNIDASGTAYVGGIAGYTKAYTGGAVATISSCVYAGNTLSSTGSGAAGAIVGNHYDGTTAFENVYYDSDIFGNNSIGRTRAGDTTGSPTGESELNSALIACTLNGGEMVDGVCTKDSPWSDAATSISLNGYGADGYKITFNANGGSFAGGATFVKYVKAGNIINNDGVANPSWGDDSYVFAGWSGDDYNKAATKATTITADWNKMHTITFSPVNGDLQGTFPNGSSESVSIKVENGKRIAVQGFERPTTFTDAQNVKYNFMGWANGDDPTILYVENGLDNLPLATEDMTLVAAWTTAPVFTVRFYEDETSTASYVSSVYENEHATELTVDKMDPHPGYTFEGWFERDAENSFDFTQNITSDVDLFAKWTKNTYTVNYVLNCSDECTNSNADEFTVDGMPLSDPEWNEKYRFLGWYADAEFKDKKTSIPSGLTDDITLYAEWETITYDITYRAGAYGTGLVAAEKKIHNEAYTLRDTSYTRKGYLQSGWVSEEGLTYAFGDEYSANAPLIVYPTWDTISYTITYECNGCDVSDNKKYPKSFNVESKFSIKDPASISAEYKFGGWFKNAEFSGNKNPNVAKGTTGDFTFYGKWNKIYKITYVGTDKPRCDTLYTVDDAITLRNPADSAGYTFGGWFTNANFEGDAATGIVKGSTGDTTFYAKWVPVPYTITYNIDGEPAELTPNTYTAASATELATPTRDGYEFDGWYGNAEYTGEKVISIEAASTGDTTFYAKWNKVYPFLVNDFGAIKVYEDENGKLTAELDGMSTGEVSTISPEDNILVSSVNFNREFPVNETDADKMYSTIVLPFSIDTNKVPAAEFYELKSVDVENAQIEFWAAEKTLQANTPYIIRTKAATLSFNLDEGETVALNTSELNNSNSEDGLWEFRGTYSYIKWKDHADELGRAYGFRAQAENSYAIGSFARIGSSATTRPFRAYLLKKNSQHANRLAFPLKKSSTSLDRASIDEDSVPGTLDVVIVERETGETTAIGTLDTRTGEIKFIDSWFDMKGRRLNAKPTTKGIYYYNGKRVIVR
ncbi:InlB B-repeat-containing protein [Fibrobacter sp. UBA3718]|uniref:InlB B-repeat-containing protein n=1 Tax=Fibrobacter sp. UBA3718 TaxID=1946531 RepID=UPI0025BFD99E|nr:InlB B-repeat-containing protein [Fibrobacter sp. UBA3718]